MIKRIYKFLFNRRAFIVVLCIVVGIVFWFIFALQPMNSTGIQREIIIQNGMGLTAVGNYLHKEQLLRSPLAFRWYGVLSGGAHKIKPGAYYISEVESGVTILERLIIGPEEIAVTIVPGITLIDLDTALAAQGIITAGALSHIAMGTLAAEYSFLGNIKSLEGFLFPDTYHFKRRSDAQMVARKILDEFKDNIVPLFQDRMRELYHALIIASLIEKEIPEYGDDRAVVSGIIHRRLGLGMGLQIDATVVYALCSGAVRSCIERVSLRRSDFQIDSLYNTYRYAGLPPTPIGNPGISAMSAALHPKKTNYLYYLSDPKTKRTIFSETLDEHNNNRARYLGL